MSKNNFYVYGLYHERPENNFIPQLFYVGRGRDQRLKYHFQEARLNSQDPVNPYKNNVIKKCQENNWKCYPEKLYDNLTLDEAKELEQFILNNDKLFKQLTNLSQSAHGGSDAVGEEHIHSKLKNKQVKHIKWLFENKNKLQYKIAEYYNISKQVLSDIKHNRSWKHITPKKPEEIPDISEIKENKVSRQIKSEIKWLLQNTQAPQKEIAEKYKISCGPVSEINCNPKKFNHLDPSKPDSIPQNKKKTAFLTDQEASKIKWLSQNTDYTQKSIGKKYNISHQTVADIKHEKIHEQIKPEKPDNTKNLKKSNYLQEKAIAEIKWLLNNTNLTQSEIGSLFNVHRKTVSSINCQKSYKEVEQTKPEDKILKRVYK